jgi:tRNA-dihydrouridine synthase B
MWEVAREGRVTTCASGNARRLAFRASGGHLCAAVSFDLKAAFAQKPVILAPMEDVTDAVFRRICRERGADICVTEFVNVEGLLRGARDAAHKIDLLPGDQPTAIQIYGADADRLAEAAEVAEKAGPSYIDINCGCWVPKIARRGAGAGWLREPDAMVAMAKMVVERVSLPVTVKTRIGWGANAEKPIVELAKRLEGAGVVALTIHCRTADMGHSGAADWSWAARAREAVKMPVIVNGDVRSAEDARRAIDETGCAGAMVGRYAIEHPWVFREARALIDRGEVLPEPTLEERIALCREHLELAKEERGELRACRALRRYYPGYLRGIVGSGASRRALNTTDTVAGVHALFDRLLERNEAGATVAA